MPLLPALRIVEGDEIDVDASWRDVLITHDDG